MSVRWWDDATAAQTVLAGVDDSDVVQGVGTAVLGLHAFAKAALVPLARQTLVDRAAAAQALARVDSYPVAQALAAATEPMLGEAAQRYGTLLADALVAKAAAGVDQVLVAFTARGLPMPLALERAAEVAGLPPNRTGRYIEALKDAQTAPIVVADTADRALMDYAAALGRHERDGAVGFAKAEGAVAFREEEHPRNAAGEFTDKPRVADAELELNLERKNRMARRARRGRRASAAQAAEQAPAEGGGLSLSQLAAVLRRPLEEPRRRAEVRRGEARGEQPRRGEVRRAPAKAAPAEVSHRLDQQLAPFEHYEVQAPDGEQMMGFSSQMARSIAAAGTFTLSGLAAKHDVDPTGFRSYSNEHLDSVGLHRIATGRDKDRADPKDMVPIVFLDDRLPIVDDEPDTKWGTGYRLSANTVWEVVNPATWEHDNYTASRPVRGGFNFDADQIGFSAGQIGFTGDEVYGAAPIPEELHRVIYVRAVQYPSESENVPDVHKADELWNIGGQQVHRQVVRDEEGEFATGGGGGAAERRERMARRSRRARRGARERAAAERPSTPEPGQLALKDLVAAVRPERRRSEARRPATRRAATQPEKTSRPALSALDETQGEAGQDYYQRMSVGAWERLSGLEIHDISSGYMRAAPLPSLKERSAVGGQLPQFTSRDIGTALTEHAERYRDTFTYNVYGDQESAARGAQEAMAAFTGRLNPITGRPYASAPAVDAHPVNGKWAVTVETNDQPEAGPPVLVALDPKTAKMVNAGEGYVRWELADASLESAEFDEQDLLHVAETGGVVIRGRYVPNPPGEGPPAPRR